MVKILKALGVLSLMRGVQGTNQKNPIVFVPGLYGSMGNDIIPGTGSWDFGMASSVYEPFLKNIQSMGYTLGKNLFIAFYDWRKDCRYSMEKYLRPVIEQAKNTNRSKKVDIICHSMGGLVSRAYVQGRSYKNDVDQLILIASPHAGAANSYSFWTEGKILSKRDIESQMHTILLEGYLWLLKRIYKYENDLEAIHALITGAMDLLPSQDYGDYLYYFDRTKNIQYIPYDRLDYKNEFLDELNANKSIIRKRGIKATIIAGKNIDTNEKFQVDSPDNSESMKILSVLKTRDGDGTVPFHSATTLEGDIYIFNATHSDILQRCTFAIRNKLGIVDQSTTDKDIVDSYSDMEDNASILVNAKGKINLYAESEEGRKLIYDGGTKHINVEVQEYSDMLKWIVVHKVGSKQIYLEYEPIENDKLDIQAVSSQGKKVKFKEQKSIAGKKYRMKVQ